jgi:hypothetical protein
VKVSRGISRALNFKGQAIGHMRVDTEIRAARDQGEIKDGHTCRTIYPFSIPDYVPTETIPILHRTH